MLTYDRPSPAGRLALALLGFVILGLLGWDVADGVIHLGGRDVTRRANPIIFWLEAVCITLVGLTVLYLAVFGLRRRRASRVRS
ncbi:hypothetical protein ACMGDM_19320 [Sphingomonas sp. DT-51]|uniref:hypothetical protein n=1 Tax=Sphingomonas sp. DT-51 TaxID=3396165 RepID=UPI003F1DC490